MAKRRAKKIANSTASASRLRRTLANCAKAELISILVELADEVRSVLRRLVALLELGSPAPELAAATRQAIADATDFDARPQSDFQLRLRIQGRGPTQPDPLD